MRNILLFLIIALASLESASAEVYLTKDQALDLVLGRDCQRHADPRAISEELKEELVEQRLWGEDSETAFFFVCTRNDVVASYALIDNEIGKHLPITYIVGISPDGKVTKVEVMVFREVRGWEVREKKFVEQFKDKSSTDELRVGRQIANISGATLSSIALTKGVRRALHLWKHFYGART